MRCGDTDHMPSINGPASAPLAILSALAQEQCGLIELLHHPR